MKLSASLSALLGASMAVLAAADWRFDVSPVETIPEGNPLRLAHQDLVKYWTVSSSESLTKLHLRLAGNVFVDYDSSIAGPASTSAPEAPMPSVATVDGSGSSASVIAAPASNDTITVPSVDERVVAKIAFSGDSSAILEDIEIVPDVNDDGLLKIRFKNQNFEGSGHLLTQVFVADKRQLVDVTTAFAADVIVGDEVLAQENSAANVSITTAGSGSISVLTSTASYSVGALDLTIAGSGDLAFEAGSVSLADTLHVTLAGSGDISVQTDAMAVNGTVETTIAGSGDIDIHSDAFALHQASTTVAGSGDITFSGAGSCETQEITVAGSGDVDASAIASVDSVVTIVGAGDVLVRATHQLNTTILFAGSVKYVGDKPAEIHNEHSVFRWSKSEDRIKEAKLKPTAPKKVTTAPPREPVYVKLHLHASLFGEDPVCFGGLTVWGSTDDATMSMMAQITKPDATKLFAVVALAFVGVGVAARRYQQRRERARYQPLV